MTYYALLHTLLAHAMDKVCASVWERGYDKGYDAGYHEGLSEGMDIGYEQGEISGSTRVADGIVTTLVNQGFQVQWVDTEEAEMEE